VPKVRKICHFGCVKGFAQIEAGKYGVLPQSPKGPQGIGLAKECLLFLNKIKQVRTQQFIFNERII
jgi:hypothetical protein